MEGEVRRTGVQTRGRLEERVPGTVQDGEAGEGPTRAPRGALHPRWPIVWSHAASACAAPLLEPRGCDSFFQRSYRH